MGASDPWDLPSLQVGSASPCRTRVARAIWPPRPCGVQGAGAVPWWGNRRSSPPLRNHPFTLDLFWSWTPGLALGKLCMRACTSIDLPVPGCSCCYRCGCQGDNWPRQRSRNRCRYLTDRPGIWGGDDALSYLPVLLRRRAFGELSSALQLMAVCL